MSYVPPILIRRLAEYSILYRRYKSNLGNIHIVCVFHVYLLRHGPKMGRYESKKYYDVSEEAILAIRSYLEIREALRVIYL
jgi:hypothetical protein